MTNTKKEAIDGEAAREVVQHLLDYAARRRVHSGARADEIEEVAATIRHNHDSNWRDCPECGWVGTVMVDGRLACEACGWGELVIEP